MNETIFEVGQAWSTGNWPLVIYHIDKTLNQLWAYDPKHWPNGAPTLIETGNGIYQESLTSWEEHHARYWKRVPDKDNHKIMVCSCKLYSIEDRLSMINE